MQESNFEGELPMEGQEHMIQTAIPQSNSASNFFPVPQKHRDCVLGVPASLAFVRAHFSGILSGWKLIHLLATGKVIKRLALP